MKTTIRIASLLSLLGAAGTGMACDYPAKVDIPSGTTATKEEMVAAYQGVKEFVANIDLPAMRTIVLLSTVLDRGG